MKRRIVLGSIIAVFLIAFVPLTNAIQIQTIERKATEPCLSFEAIKNMDAEEIVVFINTLSQDYPEIAKKFNSLVNTMENTPVSSTFTQKVTDRSAAKNQEPQPKDDNQTFLEKIFWKIFNYRVFRVYLSALLFVYFQSKFTLWRTMTWGIRLLRWVKIGILLGIIDPSNRPPQTPVIGFTPDETNNTLTVTYTSAADILWDDLSEIGAGSCDPFPQGNVTIGDMITNCTGIIVLQYLPTYEILYVFEFD